MSDLVISLALIVAKVTRDKSHKALTMRKNILGMDLINIQAMAQKAHYERIKKYGQTPSTAKALFINFIIHKSDLCIIKLVVFRKPFFYIFFVFFPPCGIRFYSLICLEEGSLGTRGGFLLKNFLASFRSSILV